MLFTRVLSITAATFVLLGGILSVVALYAGGWVDGKASVSGGSDGTVSASISLKPGAICIAAQTSANGGQATSKCVQASEIEASWASISPLITVPGSANKLQESVTASSTAAMSGNTYNLVAAGAVGCAVCIVLYLPFLIREVRGGVTIVKCCGKWTAIIGGLCAAGGGILLLASYGVIADSDIAKDIVAWWNLGSETASGQTATFTGQFTPVMDCAAAAGTAALAGALLIITRGTVCIGDDDDDHDGVGETVSPDNPFSSI